MAGKDLSVSALTSSATGTFRSGGVRKYNPGWCGGALCGCGAAWKDRHIVVKGGFLFKFRNKDAKEPLG
jgi:hypothetical protein